MIHGVIASTNQASGSSPPASTISSLLNFNGANGSTSISDDAGNTWSVFGGAALSTAQAKFGSASLLLNGSTDYIQTPNSSEFDIDGDFTIEGWMYLNDSSRSTIIHKFTNVNSGFYLTTATSQTSITAVFGTGSFEVIEGSTVLSLNTWHHVAMSKQGSTIRIFVGGVLDVQQDLVSPASNTGANVLIGRDLGSPSSRDFDGHIDSFVWTKGTAKYTANFTPPTTEPSI